MFTATVFIFIFVFKKYTALSFLNLVNSFIATCDRHCLSAKKFVLFKKQHFDIYYVRC